MQRCRFGTHFISGLTILAALALADLVHVGPAASQSRTSLIGSWSVNWQGARDQYAGRLEVLRRTGPNRFYGRVTLLPSRGHMFSQEARIFVNGSQVDIECYNPSRRAYDPDRFFVTIRGNVMTGYSIDTAGQRGSRITFTRL